jgi:hypothetical protein
MTSRKKRASDIDAILLSAAQANTSIVHVGSSDSTNAESVEMRKRGSNFLAQEDLLAVQAFTRASLDPERGSRQKKADFERHVCTVYEALRSDYVAYRVREIQSNVTITEVEKQLKILMVNHDFGKRSGCSVAQRVSKQILPEYCKFKSVLQQVRKRYPDSSVYISTNVHLLFDRILCRRGTIMTFGCSNVSLFSIFGTRNLSGSCRAMIS